MSAPNAPTPKGSHWFYRTDRNTPRKCWYLREKGEAADADTKATAPAAAGAKSPPDQLAPRPPHTVESDPAALRGSLTQKDLPDSPAGHQAEVASTTAWPALPASAPTDNLAWPAVPPPLHTGTLAEAPASTPPAVAPQGPVAQKAPQTAKPTEEMPAAVADFAKGAENNSRAEGRDPAASRGEISIGLIFALAVGLAMVGIFVVRSVKIILGQRRTIHVEREKPTSVASTARQHMPSRPVIHSAAGSVNDVPNDGNKRALQQLLQVLEQQTV